MLVISLTGIVLAWLAYSWALDQPGVPTRGGGPGSVIERVVA